MPFPDDPNNPGGAYFDASLAEVSWQGLTIQTAQIDIWVPDELVLAGYPLLAITVANPVDASNGDPLPESGSFDISTLPWDVSGTRRLIFEAENIEIAGTVINAAQIPALPQSQGQEIGQWSAWDLGWNNRIAQGWVNRPDRPSGGLPVIGGGLSVVGGTLTVVGG